MDWSAQQEKALREVADWIAEPGAPHLDHFLFAENSTRVWSLLRNWLDLYFPAAK